MPTKSKSNLEGGTMEIIRTPVQITSIVDDANGATLYVLCDDGTIWYYRSKSEQPWTELPFLPQVPSTFLVGEDAEEVEE